MRYSRTLSRWSPCSIIKPFFEVPPQAQYPLSFCAKPERLALFSSMPSIIVLGLPNFLVSSLIRIRCCSFSISPQTHKSFGSPQVEQTSAMTLSHSNVTEIYKSYKETSNNNLYFTLFFPVNAVVRLDAKKGQNANRAYHMHAGLRKY